MSGPMVGPILRGLGLGLEEMYFEPNGEFPGLKPSLSAGLEPMLGEFDVIANAGDVSGRSNASLRRADAAAAARGLSPMSASARVA